MPWRGHHACMTAPIQPRANRLGRTQQGLVTRSQLDESAGVSRSSIRRMLRSGWWHEPLPGVIDLGTHPPSFHQAVMRVLLAAGSDAWASHGTAAELHDFLDAPRPERVDVLVPRGRRALVGDVRLHTTRSIGVDEVTTVRGLACTTPARTLVDLAGALGREQIERYLANLARSTPGIVAEVVSLTDRHRRLHGRRRILDVVRRLPGDVAKLGSPLEVLGVQRLVRLGAPPFVLQHAVHDLAGAAVKRVDVAWPNVHAAIEFDGADYHDLTGARSHDEHVRAQLRALGWHVEVVRRRDLDGPHLARFVQRLRQAVPAR